MNPDVKESEYSAEIPSGTAAEIEAGASIDETKMLPPATDSMNEQWRQIGEKVYTFLSGLPEYLSEFFSEYQRPLITLGLIFGGIVGVKLTLALLDALDDIPLLSPTFELIGFGYAAWFIYRYLWKASSRQELSRDIQSVKEQILGNKGTPKV